MGRGLNGNEKHAQTYARTNIRTHARNGKEKFVFQYWEFDEKESKRKESFLYTQPKVTLHFHFWHCCVLFVHTFRAILLADCGFTFEYFERAFIKYAWCNRCLTWYLNEEKESMQNNQANSSFSFSFCMCEWGGQNSHSLYSSQHILTHICELMYISEITFDGFLLSDLPLMAKSSRRIK